MERIEEYQMQAIRLGKKRFAEAYPCFFLVKRPDDASDRAPSDDASIEYETVSWATTDPVAESGDADFAAEWRVVPVKKRAGNPFPDRISVGRARNCDVVLRFAFISKLHAHFLLEDDGALSLIDQRSANGTTINDETLGPARAERLRAGDKITFGSLRLELVTAPLLYDLLLSDARR